MTVAAAQPCRDLSSVSENWTGLALPMPPASEQAGHAVSVGALRNSTVMQ